MKKISLILVMLIAVSGVVQASGDKPKTVGMAVMKIGSTVKLFYKGEKTGNVKVTIYNDNGKVVFTETIWKIEKFVRPYNLSQMQEGDYVIELIDANGKQIEKVSHRNGKVERLINVVRVHGAENRYMVTVANKGTDRFTVRIFDSADTMVYSETETVTGDFGKIYNLNKLSGTFLFEVTDQNGIKKSIRY